MAVSERWWNDEESYRQAIKPKLATAEKGGIAEPPKQAPPLAPPPPKKLPPPKKPQPSKPLHPSPLSIIEHCPYCNQALRIYEYSVGKIRGCPRCKGIIQLCSGKEKFWRVLTHQGRRLTQPQIPSPQAPPLVSTRSAARQQTAEAADPPPLPDGFDTNAFINGPPRILVGFGTRTTSSTLFLAIVIFFVFSMIAFLY